MWRGWHGFRRGLASNLNRLGGDDSVIQAILRAQRRVVDAALLHQDHFVRCRRSDGAAVVKEFRGSATI